MSCAFPVGFFEFRNMPSKSAALGLLDDPGGCTWIPTSDLGHDWINFGGFPGCEQDREDILPPVERAHRGQQRYYVDFAVEYRLRGEPLLERGQGKGACLSCAGDQGRFSNLRGDLE